MYKNICLTKLKYANCYISNNSFWFYSFFFLVINGKYVFLAFKNFQLK